MTTKFKLLIVLVLVYGWSSTVLAEDSGYRSIDLPLPKSATNVVSDVNRHFFVKSCRSIGKAQTQQNCMSSMGRISSLLVGRIQWLIFRGFLARMSRDGRRLL